MVAPSSEFNQQLARVLDGAASRPENQILQLSWFNAGETFVPAPADGGTYRTSFVGWIVCTIFGTHIASSCEFGMTAVGASARGAFEAKVRERVEERLKALRDFVLARLRGEELELPEGVAVLSDGGVLPRMADAVKD